eukprot:6452068-Prymnesium_polylepis.1
MTGPFSGRILCEGGPACPVDARWQRPPRRYEWPLQSPAARGGGQLRARGQQGASEEAARAPAQDGPPHGGRPEAKSAGAAAERAVGRRDGRDQRERAANSRRGKFGCRPQLCRRRASGRRRRSRPRARRS